jgi:glycolate oxidase iron-sulfur subunit
MQTKLAEFIKDTAQGKEADDILRKCVHCGFCTATCPTYQLLGDELDGPRGRIYLIKQALEGNPVSARTQTHLDRCLTCRACETTCPSGVRYGRLVEIGREVVDQRVGRAWYQRALRALLRSLLAYGGRFAPFVAAGRVARYVLPARLRQSIPNPAPAGRWPEERHARRMVMLDGCVQPVLAPNFNAAAARVLDKLGISVGRDRRTGCCGAVSLHLSAREEALVFMRRNIDAWWPDIEAGAEAIVMTSSACAAMVKDYANLLAEDAAYADKARRVSSLAKDVSEVIFASDRARLERVQGVSGRVAFHAPCTLQHAQQIRDTVEPILSDLGFELTHVPQSHLCCGSAGTYSILQRRLSGQLLTNKVAALQSDEPHYIATANIGCYTHLQSKAQVPLKHWVELVDERSC